MKKLICASFVIFLAISSCKEEVSEVTPQILEKTKFLTSGTWTISAWDFIFNGKTDFVFNFGNDK